MLTIEENRVVTFEYTLTNDAGEVIDSSANHSPLVYIQGSGQIIPGLEEEMKGKIIGDKFTADIAPEKGYGPRHDELIKEIEREHLAHLDNIQVGMQLQAHDGNRLQVLTVVNVNDKVVTLDANHPLAGETLHFDVEVVDIREATSEELEFGLHQDGCGDGCSSCSGC
ncbi:MAG: peptidylprolyl isomerase [Spirochaetota bacterium]